MHKSFKAMSALTIANKHSLEALMHT